MTDKIRAITMPKWGLAMTEGLVAAWLVEEGAEIEAGAEALDIETEKITNVFETPVGGTLRRRVVSEGETAPVGALLGVVAEASVTDAELDAYVEQFQQNFTLSAAAEAEAAPEPESVAVGLGRLRYLRMGDAEGEPLVLIHGFGGDLNNWLFNQPVLAESRTVYAVDLPGHGGSGKQLDGGDVGSMTAAVLGLLDALGIDKAHLAGHSLGGAIALNLALEHPGRVASVTLVAPAALGPEINMEYIDGFIQAGRRKALKPVVEMLFADPSLVNRDMIDDLLKFKRLDGVEAALTAIAEATFAGGRQALRLADRFSDMSVPAQLIWGAEDRIVPADHANNVPAGVPQHILAGAGHMVHMEKANEVNSLIAKLISGAA